MKMSTGLPNKGTQYIPAPINNQINPQIEKKKEDGITIPQELMDRGIEGYKELYGQLVTIPQAKSFIDMYRQGLITKEQILSLPMIPENIKPYFNGFLDWIKVSITDTGHHVIGVCNNCKMTYEFASKEVFETANKTCPACKGQIDLASLVSAKCNKCSEIYDFPTKEDYETDDKTCESCEGGRLELVTS